MSLIKNLASLSMLPASQLSASALGLARLSLLDWLGCGLAGRSEPVAQKLRALAEAERGVPAASLFGGGQVPARMAALVNGATSHALDYDDTHFGHIGHLSVGIYPAVLALAEELDRSADEAVAAFLVGAEGAIRIGLVLGAAHYNLGFHQTATSGSFGATIAAGRLLGLNETQMFHAIGLCATRASGLKSQFGTMGKPYNAGLAASTGVEVAKLAEMGMSSTDDGLMGRQGFVETHTPQADPEAGWRTPPPKTFIFEQNKYKLHACCHGTHAMIEALLEIKALHGLTLDMVKSLNLRTNSRWLKVCDQKKPRTGLEVKFSYVWLAGMALRGDRTGNDRTYTDALSTDAELATFAGGVTVTGDDSLSDAQAELTVSLRNGRKVAVTHDLDTPLPLEVLTARLRSKAEDILGSHGAALWNSFSQTSGVSARDLGRVIRGEC